MNKNSKIYVAGHNGMVGSSIVRKLKKNGHNNLILRSHKELDLENQQKTADFFAAEKPEFVFLAAAKVGGILANNSFPAEFLYSNIMIQTNIIHQAYLNKCKKLLFLGSSCIYPKFAAQPMKETDLLTGMLEPTNEAYAIAKIAGIKMCQSYNKEYATNFISVMPTNLYGPNDNYNLEQSHVLPALIRKFHEAKTQNSPQVEIWGTGSPKREFLYVEDLADATYFLMQNYNKTEFINIGTGEDISIKNLADLVQETIGYEGKLSYDTSKPDGSPRKLLDITKIKSLGWKSKTKLKEGIKKTYIDFLKKV